MNEEIKEKLNEVILALVDEDYKKYQKDHDIAQKISNHYGIKFNSIEVSSNDFENYAYALLVEWQKSGGGSFP